MLKGVQNAVALVTGGGSGLGAATVRRLLDQGVKVMICDLKNTENSDLVGDRCLFHETDITKSTDIEEAMANLKMAFNRLDILVNCAGIGIAKKTYNKNKDEIHSLSEFERVMKVNAVGTFNVCRLVVPFITSNAPNEDGQRGVIINTASVAAFEGQVGQVAYSASKGAIVGMTLPMARDLSHVGIRVMTIAPGLFKTPLLSGLPEKVQKHLGAMVPFPQRLGDPDEFALLVESIIANPMLNGTVIRLDGALRMPP